MPCAAARSRSAAWTCSPSAWTGSPRPWTRDLETAAGGGSAFKAVRGEYGAGKTFFTRYLAERALRAGLRRRRGADLRDADAAAQAGDGVPADHRVAADRQLPAERVPAGAGLLAVHPGV